MASIRTRLATNTFLGKNRLSAFWTPSGGITPTTPQENDPHALLVRAGFLRQAYSGIFHLLPMGLRVQEKLEDLIDRHMQLIGASKLGLSSISSPELWQKSGRLGKASPELFRIRDRKNAGYLLSPTHEEEVTTLVKNNLKSYKDLPLRLYQIGRKYRDELRPRQGLLRTKEFLMKDLYTFDTTREAAMTAYQDVSAAYRAFFTDLQLPYVVASADSGNMGGDVSHEYHFLTPHGEDNVVSCTHCDYVANEEVAQKGPLRLSTPAIVSDGKDLSTWTGITKDRKTLVVVYFPRSSDKSQLPDLTAATESTEAVNPRSVGKLVPQIDLSIEEAVTTWSKEAKSKEAKSKEATNDGDSPSGILHIYDARLSSDTKARLRPGDEESWIPSDLKAVYSKTAKIREIVALDSTGRAVDLTRIQNGDRCHHCSEPALRIQRGIEVGHTFHLGTRYSEPLRVAVSRPKNTTAQLQMGCHGIGLSRLIGAVSAVTSTSQGLRWPRAIAPFDVAIIVSGNGSAIREDIERCYDLLSSYNISQHRRDVLQTEDHSSDGKDAGALSNAGPFLAELVPGGNFIDPVIDDREKDTGWKLKDADLIGYPIVVILGKSWSKSKLAEVKCPALGSNDLVPLEALAGYIAERLINYTKKTIT